MDSTEEKFRSFTTAGRYILILIAAGFAVGAVNYWYAGNMVMLAAGIVSALLTAGLAWYNSTNPFMAMVYGFLVFLGFTLFSFITGEQAGGGWMTVELITLVGWAAFIVNLHRVEKKLSRQPKRSH